MTSTEILLNIILTTYFSNSRCLIVVTDKNALSGPLHIPLLRFYIDHIMTNNNDFEYLSNYIGCQDFLLDTKDGPMIFQGIEREIQLHKDRFNKRKYIIITDKENIKSDIFTSPEIYYVSDVLVIVWDKINDIFTMWTHRYKGESDYQEVYLIDKWFSGNKSFLFENNLFPDKLSDQKGRRLRTAIFSYEPYVIVEPQDNDRYLYMGSEMLTLLTFANHHNMTLVPVINEFDYWGEIFENGSGNGLLGNLVDDKADIGAGALYTWESAYKFLDLSKPTVRTGITCLVPAPKLAAGWLTPVQVYSPLTWMAVMATFISSLVLIYLLDLLQVSIKNNWHVIKWQMKVKMFGVTLISVSKPFIMQNVTNKEIAKGLLGRYLIGLVFMTTLILSATYDSGLATIMTVPRYENPINTLEEFIASGLYWGATQDAWITSIQGAKEPNLVNLVARFVATSEENLTKSSFRSDFAFSVERLPRDNYAVGNYIHDNVIQNFHLMTNDFYWEYCVLMLRKNSILLPLVDMFVLRVFQAGLISFWQNEAATQYMNQYVQKAVKYYNHHQKERGIVKLKMIHVQGAFAILIIGHLVALMVFLLEILIKTRSRK